MKNNKINPIGLKGNEVNQRMIELMGIKPINENNTKSVVELTKIGPDGKTYGIVRENQEYYIKTSTKTSNLIVEDFNYIGGLQNKKSEAYPSYAKAIKHLNLNFKSLAEAYGKGGDINVFENDNLLTEDISGFSQYGGNGFSNEGNLEGNEPLSMEEELFRVDGVYTVSNSGGYEIMLSDDGDSVKVRDAFGSDNPETSDWLEIEYVGSEDGEMEAVIDPNGYNIPLNMVMKANNSLNESEEEVELTEVEQAIDGMLESDEVKNPGKYMGGEKQELGLDDDGDGVPNGADEDPKDGDIMESNFSIARAIENIDSVIDSLNETVLKKKV